jgi:hypothetical protein
MLDHAAGRLGRVIPPLERGNRHGVVKRAVDVTELDDFTSCSSRPVRLQPTSPAGPSA